MATATHENPLRQVFQYGFTLFSALLLGVIGLGFGVLLSLLAAGVLSFGAGVEMTPVTALVLGLITVQGIGCPVVAYSYIKLRPKIRPKIQEIVTVPVDIGEFRIGVEVPGLRDIAVIGVGYASAMGGLIMAGILVSTLASVFGVEPASNQAAEIGMANPELLLLLVPASFLLIGPGEELLFRGVVQGRIRDLFGPVTGVFIASVIFASIHYPALSGGGVTSKLITLSALLIPSLILGTAYEYTGNIVVPSVIHGAYNATLFTGLYVMVKYSDEIAAAGEAVYSGGL